MREILGAISRVIFFYLSVENLRSQTRARVSTRNYISILHFSACTTRDECALKRSVFTDGLFRPIERARVLLGCCMSQWPVGAVRRAASRHKVSPSFPLPPHPPSPSASFVPPALARPPSRAINERVIDARSVNRLLPFINSPGRHAAGGRIVLPQKPRGGGGDGGNHETAYGRTGRRTDTSAVTLRDPRPPFCPRDLRPTF